MGWIFYFIFFLLVRGCYFCYFRYPIARAPAENSLRATGGVTVGCYLLLLSVTLGLVRAYFVRARWGAERDSGTRRRTKRAHEDRSSYSSRFHAVPTLQTTHGDPFPCAENLFRLVCSPPIVRREASKRQVCSVFAASHTLLAVALLLLPSSTFLLTRVPTHLFVFVSARVCAWEWTSCTETHREGTGGRHLYIVSVNSVSLAIIVSNILPMVYWNWGADWVSRLGISGFR